ncbi:MAG: peptidoglycan-binding protein [Lachnospiraceae bacterium]|nr:peptidoglycan-binding protein [Lachnospiraceae bacterium]
MLVPPYRNQGYNFTITSSTAYDQKWIYGRNIYEGYTPIEIIRYYYGNDMYINSTQYVSGVPSSWPGYDLTIGSSGQKVLQLQQQLNRIAQNYPAIPKISEDGIFGSGTADAVRVFQRVFGLPANGIVDYPTWYKISEIFVGVSRISEPG